MKDIPKKSVVVTVKMSPDEIERLDSLASRCGLSRSAYLRLTSLGFRPMAAMTPGEMEAVQVIAGARADLVNHLNALRGLSRTERLKVFTDPSFMTRWVSHLVSVADGVADWLKRVHNRLEGGAR